MLSTGGTCANHSAAGVEAADRSVYRRTADVPWLNLQTGHAQDLQPVSVFEGCYSWISPSCSTCSISLVPLNCFHLFVMAVTTRAYTNAYYILITYVHARIHIYAPNVRSFTNR